MGVPTEVGVPTGVMLFPLPLLCGCPPPLLYMRVPATVFAQWVSPPGWVSPAAVLATP